MFIVHVPDIFQLIPASNTKSGEVFQQHHTSRWRISGIAVPLNAQSSAQLSSRNIPSRDSTNLPRLGELEDTRWSLGINSICETAAEPDFPLFS